MSSESQQQQQQQQPGVLEAIAAAEQFGKGGKHNYYRPLYEAAMEGDWKTIKSFIDSDPSASTARISMQSFTVLMVAASARQWKVVEELVNILPPQSLEMQNIKGFTALHMVAIGGDLNAARALVRKNPNLTRILSDKSVLPLMSSAISGSKDLVWYLLHVTDDHIFTSPPTSFDLIFTLIAARFHDIVLFLVRNYPEIVLHKDKNLNILAALSMEPSNFYSGSKLMFWEKWIYSWITVETEHTPPKWVLVNAENDIGNSGKFTNILGQSNQRSLIHGVSCLKRIRETKLKHKYVNEVVDYTCAIVCERMNLEQIIEFLRSTEEIVLWFATAMGVVEIVKAFLLYFPDLIGEPTPYNIHIIELSIFMRHAKIFKLLTSEMSIVTSYMATHSSVNADVLTMLPSSSPVPISSLSVPGAAFQLQAELQWFQEVQKLLPLDNLITKEYGQTVRQLFTVRHRDLTTEGEKWMKDTANSGMIVTALMTTVVFAAIFSTPGGNNQNGTPNYLHTTPFLVFMVSDALALLWSSTSLLMFLSILTACYEQQDFLEALPKRLIISLGSLFAGIVSMMVAFGSTLCIVSGGKWQWISIPIILLGSIPAIIFAILQLPLFIQMVKLTYGAGVFDL